MSSYRAPARTRDDSGTGYKLLALFLGIDPSVILQHAVKLKGLLEKSIDPDALSPAEVGSAVAELKNLREADLSAVMHEAGLDNMGKKKAVARPV